ncbi:hypothetical protein Tco_0295176 [Tanacetum coccineum]
MTTSKLPSLIGIRSILKGWFNKVSIVMGGIFSIEARDMDTKLLSAPESNNTLARSVVGVGVMVVVVVESSSVVKSLAQMVKFVFHLLDLSSGTVLLYQKLFEFNPGKYCKYRSIPLVGQKNSTRIVLLQLIVTSSKLCLQSSVQLLRGGKKTLIQVAQTADKTTALCTFEVDRLAAHELFIATFS